MCAKPETSHRSIDFRIGPASARLEDSLLYYCIPGSSVASNFCLFLLPLLFTQNSRKVYSSSVRMMSYNLLRGFVLKRKGTLARLSIPPIRNMSILNPLRDHIARSEVSLLVSLIFSLRLPDHFAQMSEPCEHGLLFDSSFEDEVFLPMS
jgi:hypothetical protein